MALIKFAVGSVAAFNALPAPVQATFTTRYDRLWDVVAYLRSIDPLANDYEAVVIDNITENFWNSSASSGIQGNGHSLEIYPYDESYIINNNIEMYFGNATNYTFTLIIRDCTFLCSGSSGSQALGLRTFGGANFTVQLYNNFFKTTGTARNSGGLGLDYYYANRIKLKCFNNRFWGFSYGIYWANTGPYAVSNVFIENNSMSYCANGIKTFVDASNIIVRNNVIFNTSSTCWSGPSTGVTFLNNADDDNTFPAHSGKVSGIVAGDFVSVDKDSADFLRITAASTLAGVGTLTILAENTEDPDGNARPTAGGTVSIGAYEPAGVAPAITDQPDPITKLVGETGTFSVTATGIPAVSYQWRKNSIDLSNGYLAGVGTISGALTDTLTITGIESGADDDYDVVVSNGILPNATSNTAHLTVTLVVAAFSGTPTSGTVPVTVVFTDTSTGSPTSWLWDFGDGNTSTSQNPTHTYTVVGVYTVVLTATRATYSDSETKIDYITVNNIIASFTGTPTSGAASLYVQFTGASTGSPDTWLWNFGDGNTSTEQNPVHSYSSPGIYTVSLTAWAGVYSDTETKTNYITVTEIVPDFSGTPTEDEVSFNCQFTDLSTGTPLTWFWNFGDGSTSTEVNPVHQYTVPGIYTVSLTVTSPSGATLTKTRVNYIRATGAAFTGLPVSGKVDFRVNFTESSILPAGSTIISYSWDFGDTGTSSDQNPKHWYTVAGEFDVTLTITTDMGVFTLTRSKYIIAQAGLVSSVGPQRGYT